MVKKSSMKARKYILYPVSALFIGAIVLGLISPKAFYEAETAMVGFTMDWLGWLFGLVALSMLFLCLYIVFSKKGDIILGGKNAEPLISRWAWAAITLCGGIASGVVFWGIAEPLTHFMNPIPGMGINPMTQDAAVVSIGTTFIHWAFPYYVFYTICGVAVGFSCYNMKLQYAVSSTLYPVFGKKVKGVIGKIVDLVCIFGIAGGVSAVLGVISMQIASGINFLFGIPATNTLRATILIVVVVTFIISSYTGLTKGIRILSDLNSKIFIFFMVFVFLFGPTKFILSLGFKGFGYALDNFFTRATFLSSLDGEKWPQWWTVIYYVWSVAYGPMMGMFLGKISKGRSLREFVGMNLAMPAIFNVLWFAVFGSAAIKLELSGAGLWQKITELGTEASVFVFFENFTLGAVFSGVFILAAGLSVVTLCDSMTSTIAAMSVDMGENLGQEPPNKMKIYWALLMSSLAFINIVSASSTGEISGIDATKQIVIATSGPLLILCLLQTIAVIKMLIYNEKYDLVEHPDTALIDPEMRVDNDNLVI